MSGIFAVFTPDCVSFCEVSSHAANSKGRRLRFLGSHRRIVMLFYLILFAPDSFRNLFNQLELVPLLQPGQLVADLAGGKTTLRAQAEAVHFSASWMRAITVSLCRKRPDFEQRGCFHQRAGPWCAGRLPGSASGQCGFIRRDWCRCPGRPCLIVEENQKSEPFPLSRNGSDFYYSVRITGLEPARRRHWTLKPARLPIPPYPLKIPLYFSRYHAFCQCRQTGHIRFRIRSGFAGMPAGRTGTGRRHGHPAER